MINAIRMIQLREISCTVGLTVSISLLTGCSLPSNQSKKDVPIQSHAEKWITSATDLEKLEQKQTAYLALDDAFLSIASRLHLIRNAKYTIDLQYYIWENDAIGHLMFQELLHAADRGVKVRLLIDDQNGTKLDPTLQSLSAHPNISIKLFNPYKFRKLRVIDYAFRLKHINHRMHNKLIIADGFMGVTGGRNISNEYFDASESFQFTDLDILFYGEAIQQANQVFLNFWNDDLSYSVQQWIGAGTKEELNQLRQTYQENSATLTKDQQRINYAQQQLAAQLKLRPVNWAEAHFIADSPNKIRGEAKEQELIYNQFSTLMGQPKERIELVSAYFVPTQQGTDFLTGLAGKNVEVRVLTNSFLANDVAVVHAFYQKYRKDLLENGVKLYEFKPYIERSKRTWYEVITGNIIPAKGKNASSLHAKFFDIDGMVFIGSFNFDPRSANLNSEVGLVVKSDRLQNDISAALNQYLPQIAYELKLDENGEIIWLEHQKNGKTKTYTHEPETTRFQRFSIKAVSYLPIEWMM